MRILDKFNGKYLKNTTESQDLKLMSILFNSRATRSERLFLVGRLKFFGYTMKETFEAIDKYNKWEGYNKSITERWLALMYKIKSGDTNFKTHTQSPVSPHYTWEDLKNEFSKNTLPISSILFSNDIKVAAIQLSKMGFHVLPKSPKGKYPSIPWRKYGDVKPTEQELLGWNWQHGLCIVVTKQYCFLDIDEPTNIVYPGHWERTPRGGAHLFGLGNLKTKRIDGKGEIKGYGSLIVSAPTPGYVVMP